MNKIVKLMCLLALVAVVGTSCKKAEKVQSFQATLGEMVVEGEEKMSIEGVKIVFEENDPMVLYNVNEEEASLSVYGRYHAVGSGTSVTFVADDPMDNTTMMDAFFGYYPGNQCAPDLGNNNHCYFELQPTQTYRTRSNNTPMVPANGLYAACKDTEHSELANAHFSFQQIGGILKLKLYTSTGKKVKSITITDKDLYLSGFVSMNIAEVDPVELTYLVDNYNEDNEAFMDRLNQYINRVEYSVCYTVDDYVDYLPSKSVTLEMPNGVTLGTNAATATTFYIGLRPLALWRGFEVDVTYTDNTHAALIQTTANNKIKPGVIKAMPAIAVN